MRRAARVDANQGEIVSALRRAGATVEPLHSVGDGVPDLLVGYRGLNLLIEVKDGAKPPSDRKLNDRQFEWHQAWRGQSCVVDSIQAALEAVGIEHRGQVT